MSSSTALSDAIIFGQFVSIMIFLKRHRYPHNLFTIELEQKDVYKQASYEQITDKYNSTWRMCIFVYIMYYVY